MCKKCKKIKKRILGYNKEVKQVIKERRKKCTEWKKEKHVTRKTLLKNQYLEMKRNVNNMIETTEAEEISKMIDKSGEEKIDFWKTMKRIRNKEEHTTKIRKEDGELTEDI